jgi:hypothetical protein
MMIITYTLALPKCVQRTGPFHPEAGMSPCGTGDDESATKRETFNFRGAPRQQSALPELVFTFLVDCQLLLVNGCLLDRDGGGLDSDRRYSLGRCR